MTICLSILCVSSFVVPHGSPTRRYFEPPARPVCGLRPGSVGPPHVHLLEAVLRTSADQGPLPESVSEPGLWPRAVPAPATAVTAQLPAAGGHHGDREGERPDELHGFLGGGGEDKPYISRHPHRCAALHEGALPASHATHAETNHRAGFLHSVSHSHPVCVCCVMCLFMCKYAPSYTDTNMHACTCQNRSRNSVVSHVFCRNHSFFQR